MDDRVVIRAQQLRARAGVKAAKLLEVAIEVGDNSSGQSKFQTEDKLDMEIENIRGLMMKVSQKQQTTARKKKNFSKGRKRRDCESTAGGKLQKKIWRPGEVQLESNAAVGQHKNKVWDPGKHGLKAHDQNIISI